MSFYILATPDISVYQYDELSGFYYDPSTGLYYDPNSQYYYNSEIAAYLYWDQEKNTYVLATQNDTSSTSMAAAYDNQNKPAANQNNAAANTAPASNPIAQNDVNAAEKDDKKPDQKHDKVKVAKKIVKDMERWAKQLNQKKEMTYQPIQQTVKEEEIVVSAVRQPPLQRVTSGYADVGFTILENRESRPKSGLEAGAIALNKAMSSYTSDSDNEAPEQKSSPSNSNEMVDYDKLACLLCKRAFQSLDILNKHVKMSNLHKENLQKYNQSQQSRSQSDGADNALSYRDRAKERRLKYGEADPPPPNRSRERFEREMRKQTAQLQKQASSNLAKTPIDGSNVGNRLLQKMGWTEGQGLGRSNQGRTNIIEVSSNFEVEADKSTTTFC